MLRRHFDVIVVGGGPAGSAAAYTLATRGIDVCLVDKCFFPRDKLCGGLLTLRSKKTFEQIFGITWDPIIEVVSRGVAFYHKGQFLNSVRDYRNLYFTRRYNFDDYLLGLVRNARAQLLLGIDVREIDIDEGTLTLGNGISLSFKYLIGADGVNSRVAKTLFGNYFDKTAIAYGLEMEVPVTNRISQIADPEIYFGVVRWGYGWVFPKKEALTIGVGGLHSENPALKNAFIEFVKMRLGDVPTATLRGHYIPFGNYRAEPGRNNILLCGDAAGLVDPITGEGVAFAMQSGYYAALSIAEAVQKKMSLSAFDMYCAKYRRITHALDQANMLRNLIFPKCSQHTFVSVLPKTQSVPRKHMDLLADEIEYGQYVRFLMAKIAQGIVRRIVPIKR